MSRKQTYDDGVGVDGRDEEREMLGVDVVGEAAVGEVAAGEVEKIPTLSVLL